MSPLNQDYNIPTESRLSDKVCNNVTALQTSHALEASTFEYISVLDSLQGFAR